MKKLITVMAIVAVFTLSMLCVGAVSAAQEPVSPGPAPNSGDGIHDGPGWELEP